MVNERIDIIRYAGSDAVQLRFDLADAELLAVARSVAAVATERFRGFALDADGALELRDMTALHDAALERAEDGHNGGTLVLSVRRLGLLIGVLGDWVAGRLEADFQRVHEATDLLAIEGVIADLRAFHARGPQVALGVETPDFALS